MKRLLFFIAILITINSFAQNTNFEEIINYYRSEKNFNGSVLVSTDGKIDFLTGVGIANRQSLTLINSKSKFKIASITKTFTAVLILQLYEEGKIDLKSKIGNYLSNYKGEAKDKVSIINLLTYSSGIPNCEGNTGIEVYQKPISTDEFITKYCSGKLEFEPGKQFSYDNGDYIILGKIIETITGKSFEQNLKDKILSPLNMENTNLLKSKDIVNGLVPTYNIDEKTLEFFNDDPMYIENYFSSGAIYSTVEDILKFDTAIFDNKILKKKTVEIMLTPFPELYGVALGFWVTENKFGNTTTKVANRQGSIWGANTNWLHLIEKNKAIIVFSNTNATNLTELTEQIVLVSTNQNSTIPNLELEKGKEIYNFEKINGTWVIDLRPDPNSEAYLKDFVINPTTGKDFGGEFYGTKFTNGKFNTDWEYLYFAFTTSDKENIYYHSGYIDGNKVFGISYSPDRKFISHWKGTKK